jgi:hypothetical protein
MSRRPRNLGRPIPDRHDVEVEDDEKEAGAAAPEADTLGAGHA